MTILLSTPAAGSSRPQSISTSETPWKPNMSSTNVFMHGSLEEQRQAVFEDLGPIPEVTVDFMLKYIIPDSKVDVQATMESLRGDGIWSENDGWKEFEGHSPKTLARQKIIANNSKTADRSNLETQIFLRMKRVYSSIISSTQFRDGKNRPPTLYFDQFPNTAPVSDTGVKTRPDCCGILMKDQAIHSSHQKEPPPKPDDEYGIIGRKGDSKRNLVLNGTEDEPLNWYDIACVDEYKVNDRTDDLNDNVLKIIWSLHHMMQVDHRRRFTFGTTIENEDVRIWFACRQIVLVSQPFNFKTNASELVQLVASLAYADTTQLGYDPTMSLRWRLNGWHYNIIITTKLPDGSNREVKYRTIKVMSDTAYNLRGRATRVYVARGQGISTPSGHVILKDSWIDADRPKEGDTLSQLLEGASERERELFLTIYQHGIVQIEGQDDSTQGLILKGQLIELPGRTKKKSAARPKLNRFVEQQRNPLGIIKETREPPTEEQVAQAPEVRIFNLFTPPPAPNSRSSTSRTGNSTSDGKSKHSSDALPTTTHTKYIKPIIYSNKVHYRIAFEEVGRSLMEVAELGRLTTKNLDTVLHDVTMALKYMAKKGYVHRDVSAGNIILYKNRAKLSDLEFSKKYGAGATSYVRTGTYSFMAGEVMKGKYSAPKYADQNASVPFVHNPIHDLESLWWVGVWCSIWHYPAPFKKVIHHPNSNDPSSDPQIEYIYRQFTEEGLAHVKTVKDDAEELFPTQYILNDNFRIEEIHSKVNYASRGNDEYPDELAATVYRLEHMRQCISWGYKKSQKKLPRNEASYFTDVLRIADPSVEEPGTDDDEETEEETAEKTTETTCLGIKIPVHNRILQILDGLKGVVGVEDAILWPIDSIEQYPEWLKTQERQRSLRPRRHLVYGITNMDPYANYHDY